MQTKTVERQFIAHLSEYNGKHRVIRVHVTPDESEGGKSGIEERYIIHMALPSFAQSITTSRPHQFDALQATEVLIGFVREYQKRERTDFNPKQHPIHLFEKPFIFTVHHDVYCRASS